MITRATRLPEGEAKPLNYTVMSTVEQRSIEWLWNPYIPRGAVSLLIGDGGIGKSTITCALAADLSQGRALPGQDALPPQRVLMLSAEDGINPVMINKLQRLDANLDNIAGYEEGFTLTLSKAEQVLASIRQFDATIVFLDPLVSFLGGGMDMNRSNETRAALNTLVQVAKEANVAIVFVHHIRKQEAAKDQHRSMGSADIVNISRSVVLADMTKDGQHIFSHVKANWSAKGPSLAYSFDGQDFEWLGEYQPPRKAVELSHTPRSKAKDVLRDILSHGAVPALEVLQRAAKLGIAEKTLKRAKLGLATSVRRTSNGPWLWELYPEALPAPEPPPLSDQIIPSTLGNGIVDPSPSALGLPEARGPRGSTEPLDIGEWPCGPVVPGVDIPTSPEPTSPEKRTSGPVTQDIAALIAEARAKLRSGAA